MNCVMLKINIFIQTLLLTKKKLHENHIKLVSQAKRINEVSKRKKNVFKDFTHSYFSTITIRF